MSNKKQTAVEWLLNNLHKIGVDYNLSIKAESGWLVKRNEIIEQAKAMEKEQIIDAHIEGQRVFDEHPHTQWTNDQAEQYYKETYED